MWDTNLLMSDGQVVTADGWSGSAIAAAPAPNSGLPLELAVSYSGSAGGSDSLHVSVYAKDTDGGWSTTPSAAIDRVCAFNLITALSAREFQRVFTNKAYIKAYYDITDTSGSAQFTCALGVVSGFQRDAGI